jgi:hypothetical protein
MISPTAAIVIGSFDFAGVGAAFGELFASSLATFFVWHANRTKIPSAKIK